MPELVLSAATGIYSALPKPLNAMRAWVALQQSYTLPREDKIKHILSRVKSCLRQHGQHDKCNIPKLVKLTELWF